MSPIQRIEAVLSGRQPDRPPFSFWYHFPPHASFGEAAVGAHLDHLEKFGLDFLKVMNENGYPHHRSIREIDDLSTLVDLSGDEPEFTRQLELISSLRARLKGRVFMATTIFNSWAVLRELVQILPDAMQQDAPSEWIRRACAKSPQIVSRALQIISKNLARFAARCIDAGADGIFLSTRDDWVDGRAGENAGFYRRIVRPLDRSIITAAARGRFNVLHVCGKALDFRSFGEFPVQVINWADRSAGPPIESVKSWLEPAICAGINHERTLINGSPGNVKQEIDDAIRQAGDRPIIIAPGCTFDPKLVPQANLRAIVETLQLPQ